MKYIIGLDIGIGSIGWAVVKDEQRKHIVDFGVRIFDSGESNNGKDRKSQSRRNFRGIRRLIRRRSHRKNRLKAHLQNIGLVSVDDINLYFESGSNNIIETRVKGLDYKLSPQEIAACLINICNRRGYKDFYEVDELSLSDDELKIYKSERQGASVIIELMQSGKYRSVAEMFWLDELFQVDGQEYRKYRNSKNNSEIRLVSRKLLEDEVDIILRKQQEFYPCLTRDNIDIIKEIVFRQRDFEEGPGNEKDKLKKYTGFLDTLGKCIYYKDELRGFRNTVLSDIYALVNVLSQYKYMDINNNITLPRELAQDMVDFALTNGYITKKDVKSIAKKHNFQVNIPISEKGEDITKCLKFIRPIKPIFEAEGYTWGQIIQEDYNNLNSLLNRTGEILSKFQTPSRRKSELKNIKELSESLIQKLALQRFSGTASVSYHYMKDAIESFLMGDIYGVFQANRIKEIENNEASIRVLYKKLPAFNSEDDCEFYKNPVVYRSINETRKIINAIVNKYGSPFAINIEVASELNKCYEDRLSDIKRQNEYEKARENARIKIAELMGINESEVTSVMIEKFRLGESQGWRCLYSNSIIDQKLCLSRNNRDYEIDHIVPFSLVLDNTIHNKALVLSCENQHKGQRTPLMYLTGEKAQVYRGVVNTLFKEGKISNNKYRYLMLETFDEDLLSEWKSRNLNDTRYICKYLVNYLSKTMEFSNYDNNHKHKKVYAVKSSITSYFRRLWLNEKTWGIGDKAILKENTLLDHAIDAVVIANCLPAYVEIASENLKLRRMFKKAGNKETDEYKSSLNRCVESMWKFYRMDRQEAEQLLRKTDRTPSLINNLRDEVDIRFIDPDIFRRWEEKAAEYEHRKPTDYSDNEIFELFKQRVIEFYQNDIEFAKKLTMPLVSYKPNRKYSGEITTANPISIKEIDGVSYQLKHMSILKLKKKDIDFIHTNDEDLIKSLKELFENVSDKVTVADVLKDRNKTTFITKKQRRINQVTLKTTAPAEYLIKNISENNQSFYDNRSYYCVEIYKDKKEQLHTRGITYSDLVKKYGKLWLKPEHIYPDDYEKHLMYLYKNDYIQIKNKQGKIKFEGYYKSVFNINQNAFRYAKYNTPCDQKKCFTLAKTDTIKKFDIGILGEKGGEIKCGEPLSLIKEKK